MAAKLTGFSRFVLAMIFIIPVSFGISHYVNGGEFTMDSIKETLGMSEKSTTDTNTNTNTNNNNTNTPKVVTQEEKDEIAILKRELEQARDGIEALQDDVKMLKEEVANLKGAEE